MTIVDFVRLILKHLVLLIVVPLMLGCMVIVLTMNPSFKYSSQTILYTGLATGSSIEMDKKFNYQATNTAFDNLINIIKSRETQEEVAIRLLALHLLLPEANPKYISQELFDKFQEKLPEGFKKRILSGNKVDRTIELGEYNKELFPEDMDRYTYEATVQSLTNLMRSGSHNFVYELLNYDEDEHYSLKVISQINAQRINSSDLIKLSYTVNDPGICQQTLAIYSRVCIANYKHIKENRSDAVVRYFENELEKARVNLKKAEDKLLAFNKSSNIINYYEQSKAVAVVKEDMEVNYKKITAELAGFQAGTKKLAEKLKMQEAIQAKSEIILAKKKKLGSLNFKIALMQGEIESINREADSIKIIQLKKEVLDLREDVKNSVNELYSYQNSVEGLPISKVLPDWMNNVVESEKLKAQIRVIESQNNDFQEVYAEYAPAGANMKRIEREISVSEQGYLEILHGLNLAKLKLQDSELSSSLKTIDVPYYPLSPNPTKRAVLIIAASFLGAILTLSIIFVMEYFDDTLRNSTKASKILNLQSLGMIPKMMLNPGNVNFGFVQKRLIEIITQNILLFLGENAPEKKVKTIVVFSTQKMEGKSVIAGNIAKILKQEGKKVLFLNHEGKQEIQKQSANSPILNKILGYPDPRIDFDSPFLANVSEYLDPSEFGTYKMDTHFYNAKNYTDILKDNNMNLEYTPDYVIIELPALIYHNYPAELIKKSDLAIMVCRANRIWAEADKSAMKNLLEASASKINFIINGVNINEIESLLGDLPKQRTRFRKKAKSIFKFQFFSKNKI